ncbi:hypothetical protein O6H91_07G082100 [Diphasiastrum complanatum]|uniref:Uncharacterized protein n=2 Tax=Diphasiastrum complanatum TaxID=34168 RepID=A0ACC2D772_DIPCM|nr:hypothetical protein O6H91_07G082100 [Diphasiastrum complanatum]KAJ7550086.1 hypothetical protein O6H91_07G082100 [Diphasiastrum complanatum]
MGKSARWLKKIFGVKKSSKSPLKEKSSWKGNDQDQAIAIKISNGKQSATNAPAQEQLKEELMDAIELVPNAEDQQFIQVKQEPTKPPIATIVEAVTPHPSSPTHVIQPSLQRDLAEKAAVKIQTAFRGYLAHRAFLALKGLVRLQALVRGHQVRKQAALSLRCILAIVKVQAHIRAYRVRMSKDGQEAQKFLCSRYQSPQKRKIVEGLRSPLKSLQLKGKYSKQGNMVLAYALQRQFDLCAPRQSFCNLPLGESESGWCWLERWTVARPWALLSVSKGNTSLSPQIINSEEDAIDSMPVRRSKQDTQISKGSKSRTLAEPTPSSKQSTSSFTMPSEQNHPYLPHEIPPADSSWAESSPVSKVIPLPPSYHMSPFSESRSSNGSMPIHDTLTSQAVTRNSNPVEKENQFASSKNTSSFSNGPKSSTTNGSPILAKIEHTESHTQGSPSVVPSYMATTESAKAKVRSNSTPRNRPDLLEQSPVIYKRRLSLPGSNGKTNSEATHSQRWNSNVRTSNMGFTSKRVASSLRNSSGE